MAISIHKKIIFSYYSIIIMAYLAESHFKDLSYLPQPVNKKKEKKQKNGSGIIPDIVPFLGVANKVLDNIPVGSVVNTAIDLLPFEAHLPGYNFLGPGTRLDEKIKNKVKPINPLDAAAFEHDKLYASTKDNKKRSKADNLLENRAWNRVLADDSSLGEKAAAWLTTNAMKVKQALGGGLPHSEGGVIIHSSSNRRKKKKKKKKMSSKKQKKALKKKKISGGGRRRRCPPSSATPKRHLIKNKKKKKKKMTKKSKKPTATAAETAAGRGMVIMKKTRGNGLMEAFLKARSIAKKKRKK